MQPGQRAHERILMNDPVRTSARSGPSAGAWVTPLKIC